MPERSRLAAEARETALATLAFLAALEAMRALVPHVDPVYRAFALGRSFSNAPSPGENVAYAIGFTLVLAAPFAGPVVARIAKSSRHLLLVALAAGIARAALSLAPSGRLAFWASVATLGALLGGLVPLALERLKRQGYPHAAGAALLLALALDLALVGLGSTYDASLLPGFPWVGLGVAALLPLAAVSAPALPPPDDPSRGVLRSALRGVALGLALALASTLFLSPAPLARWTRAPLVVATLAGFLALAIASGLAFARAPQRRERALAALVALAAAPALAALALLLPSRLAPLALALAVAGAAAIAALAARAVADEARARGGFAPAFWAGAIAVALAAHVAYALPFARSPRWREIGELGNVLLLLAATVAFLALALAVERFGPSRAGAAPARPRALAVGLLACALALPALVPSWPAAAEPAEGAPFLFVSFNVHQGVALDARQDWPAIADLLLRLDADVVALQEIETGRAARLGVDGLAYLAKRLGMEESFAPTIGREYGNAVLSRFPVVETERILLPSTAEQRGAARARIDVGGGRLVDVYSMHLGFSGAERLAQTTEIARRVAASGVSALVAGDFNDFSQVSATGPLAALGMHRSQDVVSSPPVTFTTRNPRIAIDFVFGTSDLAFLAHRVDATCLSDHFPVLAAVGFASEPPVAVDVPEQRAIRACA